jgi:hypothetical protein
MGYMDGEFLRMLCDFAMATQQKANGRPPKEKKDQSSLLS